MTDFFTKNAASPKVSLGTGVIDQSSLFISSWNINGLRAVTKRGSLQHYISSKKPDIYCLNELKITEQKFHSESLEQFFNSKEYPYQYFNFCKPPIEGYSGVAIISKFAPKKVEYEFYDKKFNSEGRFLCLEFDQFYLVATYVPNSGQNLDRLEERT